MTFAVKIKDPLQRREAWIYYLCCLECQKYILCSRLRARPRVTIPFLGTGNNILSVAFAIIILLFIWIMSAFMMRRLSLSVNISKMGSALCTAWIRDSPDLRVVGPVDSLYHNRIRTIVIASKLNVIDVVNMGIIETNIVFYYSYKIAYN